MDAYRGEVALVTGASKGIGRAVADALAPPAHVQVHDVLVRPTRQAV